MCRKFYKERVMGVWNRIIQSAGRPLWLVPLAVLAGLIFLQGLVPNWATWLEGWTVDARFYLRGTENPQSPIVIVALDEKSVRMMGALQGENVRTWPRARWADLVHRIAVGHPRIIGLDVVFDTPGWDEGGDESLADALSDAGNVVLAANYDRTVQASYELITLSAPLDILARSSAGIGLTTIPTDVDRSVRKMGAFYEKDGQDYPTFPLTVASIFAGELVVDEGDIAAVNGSFPIHFRGPEGTFQTVSMYGLFADELAGAGVMLSDDEIVDPRVFQDAIVLVGYTARIEQDRHRTPFGGEAKMPGVEVQANAIDTFLSKDWLCLSSAPLKVALVGLLGSAALGLLNLRRPGTGVLMLGGVLILYLVLGQALFVWGNFVLALAAPMLTAVVVGGVTLAERMIFAERDKRRLRRRFAGVMSEERLRAVLDQWESLVQMDRPQKAAAVLFADIRGFTSTTEALMRQSRVPEMVGFLTAYLDSMTEAVFVEGGVVYDVVGDGLMILFGVPGALPDYALQAVRGAVRMALATEALQEVWPLRDQRPLRIGIGVHCGSLVDAVVGRGRRVEYSVIGDPVNTAARIESHCKVAMNIPRPPGGQVPETVTVLLSADLYAKVREYVLVDESIPPFEARGKSEPLQVVRLLGLREEEL
jgi:adenylate cyclase